MSRLNKSKGRLKSLTDCQREIQLMLARSKTKVIAPTLTLGLLLSFRATGKNLLTEKEVKASHTEGARFLQKFMRHSLHVGAKWEDAYSRRTLPKYKVLRLLDSGYELLSPYTTFAETLIKWIPAQIRDYVDGKLGIIPKLADEAYRMMVSQASKSFVQLLEINIETNPANFEFICFAVLRVHLEKFACKIYRDSRTSAHDKGVDISTNFGVVYQIKKLRVVNQKICESIANELQSNFDKQRLDDGKVIIIIDDIRKDFRDYLINMKIQSITKPELLKLAQQFEDIEDRQKVLRIIYDEFRREYASVIS